jgi:phosphotransferase system HPr (HPr) family protein
MCPPKATRTVAVNNREGIHVRAAMLIAELVRRHDAKVTLIKENNKADGSEVLQIFSLGTGPGEQLVLEATGDEAEKVLDALAKLFAEGFPEGNNETNS